MLAGTVFLTDPGGNVKTCLRLCDFANGNLKERVCAIAPVLVEFSTHLRLTGKHNGCLGFLAGEAFPNVVYQTG